MAKVPIIYTYLYMKIKESNKTSIINRKPLKESIARVILRRGGIPRFFIKYIIDDLIELKLIERITFNEYKITCNACDKKIKQLLSYC